MADSIPVYDWSEQKNFTFKHDFIAIKIIGNVAWAILNYQSHYFYRGVDTKERDLQTVVLEKVHGSWKISCFVISTVQPPAPIAQQPSLVPSSEKKQKAMK